MPLSTNVVTPPVGRAYSYGAASALTPTENNGLDSWREACNAVTAESNRIELGTMENMDATKLTGVLMSAGLTTLVIMTASPSTLALLDLALIGALYVIRIRRQQQSAYRPRKKLG